MEEKNIREALWANYDSIESEIKKISSGDETYEIKLEERDKIRNELLKLEQLKNDREIKNMQFEIDKKNEFIRNLITIGTFSINFIGCVYFTCKSFDFDKQSTMTSTMGRGILSNFMPKLFKK